jgi:site-specific recombinase XerD
MTASTGKRKAHFKNSNPTDPKIIPFKQWTPENRYFYADFCLWLKQGRYSASACNTYSVAVRFAIGYLNLPFNQIQLEHIEQVRNYLKIRPLSPSTLAGYFKGLNKLVEYLNIPRPEADANWVGYLNGISPSLTKSLRGYVMHCSRSWRKDSHIQLARNLLSRLSTFCRSTQINCIEAITPKVWLAYAEARLKAGIKPTSINAALRTLQSLLNYLHSQGTPICTRMLEVRPLKIGQHLPRDLSISQVKLLLNAIQDNAMDRAWVLLMLHRGLRTGEVRNLKISDVVFSQRTVYIHKTKNQHDRVVYLSPLAVEAIQDYPSKRGNSNDYFFIQHHKQLSKRYCQSRLKTIGKQLGIKVSPHQLRHTCGTLLLNAGMSIFALQSLLGHRYVETTLKYAHLYDETVAKQFLEARVPSRSCDTSWYSNTDTGR